MAQVKSQFFCKNCGAHSTRWLGKCPSCGEYNTLEEEVVYREESTKGKSFLKVSVSKPKKIEDISLSDLPRLSTGYNELDNVLGGGIVSGSLVLLGGEPGIGKSTLLLQMALTVKNSTVLYVSGEESENQLKMRATRLAIPSQNSSCYILTETNTQNIFQHIEKLQPNIVIIDSVQTLQSNLLDSVSGSISQIKECAAEFQHFAKISAVPVFLIGHITKEGSLAGPKVLEHIVDTVLQFEGDQHYGYRIIRGVKNRFGSTSELAIFEMQSTGLKEVTNPSEILLTQHDENFSGSAVAAIMEGNRPLLIETQALVSSAVYGMPQRATTGFDLRRTNMLLAVLEKRCHFKLGSKDVFLNIAGRLRVEDPAIDLAVVVAILSSSLDQPVNAHCCFTGEIGLSGEIRPVTRIEQRIAEADKLGFNKIFLSKYNMKGLHYNNKNVKLFPISKVEELFELLFTN